MNCDCRTPVCIHDAARDYGREWSEIKTDAIVIVLVQTILIASCLALWFTLAAEHDRGDTVSGVVGCAFMSWMTAHAIAICWRRFTRRR